ncbi:RNA polymerase factor sigma-54 [Sandaracinobacteroides hominis]|uniref:RNA polymerase factor sigma-54 n=1 Tax=Sandaracinobacteroides hominis TaxID=2780086 RepID=UPI0018F511B0|nr:RNA polymerase factor sigma-54 [Sandaracinobacteroides hominis]
MALGPRLDLRTSQTLVISPQLQAAIKLLTLSNLELHAEIAAELDRNPLLELADDGEGGGADNGGNPDSENPPAAANNDPGDMDTELAADDGAHRADDLDIDYAEERFHQDSIADTGRAAEPSEDFSFDQIAADELTLAEVLERQAMRLSGADLAIALHIISLIDEAGYLTEPVEAIAGRLGMEPEAVEAVLAIVQGFEPTGVGARNLAECIALQAKEADRYDPCMAALIDNLDLVARGDLAQLRRLCSVDAEDLADMLRELRGYNPKPGLVHGGGRTVPVVPDIFVRRTAKGWTVELNSGTLPRLIVNRQYQARIAAHATHVGGNSGAAKAKPERQFLDSCVSQAHWLMKALDQRATTIMKVAMALVEEQAMFFEKGVSHLKPLTLKQIADTIEMHESTVSRVTSNKYLSCDRGVFELKYFFTTAIHSAGGGGDASAEAVRQRLKALIEGEEPLKPLSDDKLVELLKKDGYDLARRTVTKYREAMGIASSFDRRRRAVVKAA